MGEGLVGLCHLVGIFTTLDCSAKTVGGIQDFVAQALGHGLLAASLRVANQPAQCEGGLATRLDFNRNLVGGATNTAGLDLEARLDVLHGLLQGNYGISTGLLTHTLECTVNDALCGGLLAVYEDLVDQLRDQRGAVYGIYY